MRIAAYPVLILALSACGFSGANSRQESHTAIRGGDLVRKGQWEARHSLVLWDGRGNQFCSAVRIGPNQIATAAHCLAAPIPEMQIGFGPGCTDVLDSQESCRAQQPTKEASIKVLTTTVHPLFSSEALRDLGHGDDYHDIGMIVFQGELAVATTPIANFADFPTDNQELGQDHELIKTGFGSISDDDDSKPALRSVRLRVVRSDPANGELEYMRHQNRGTCPGDSGGPGFISTKGDKQKLVGITSRGPDMDFRNSGDNEMSCNDGNGIDTDIRYYRDWLQCAGDQLNRKLDSLGITTGVLKLRHEPGDGSADACADTAIELHADFHQRVKAQCESDSQHVYKDLEGACERTHHKQKKPRT